MTDSIDHDASPPRAADPPQSGRLLLMPAFMRASISEQIGVSVALLVLVFALLIGAASFAYTLNLTQETERSKLNEAARDAANALAATLNSALGEVQNLAVNPTVVSGVLDSGNQETYLKPLLTRALRAGREVNALCVTDYRGRVLACEHDQAVPALDPAAISAVVEAERAQSWLAVGGNGSRLQVALPVINPESGGEGAVIVEFAVDVMLHRALGDPQSYRHLHLHGSDGQQLFWHGDTERVLHSAKPLVVDPLLQPLGLTLGLGVDSEEIAAPARRVMVTYALLALALLPIAYFSARHLGRLLTKRIVDLAAEARQLARSNFAGNPQPSAKYGDDEIGQLAQALAKLIGELNADRAQLELRVGERTRALAESEANLRVLTTAVEQNPSAIVMTDLHGDIQYVNAQFERISGYPAAEVLGRNPRLLKSSRLLPFEYVALWAALTNGQAWRGEFENVRKDGRSYWVLASIAPLKNAEGAITGYVAVEEDITERKRFERATREREHFLAGLIDSLPDFLFAFDDTGCITTCHTPDKRLMLMLDEQFVGRNYADVLPADMAAPLRKLLSELGAHGSTRQFDYELVLPEGSRIFSASIRRINADDIAGGGFIMLARDMTESRRLHARLIATEARFRNLLEDISSVAIQGYDRHHRVVFWNKASEQLYGYRRDQAIGQRIEDLIIPVAMRVDVEHAIDTWLDGGAPIAPAEMSLRRADGSAVTVFSSHAKQIGIDGEPELYCVDIDLTARRAAEARMREALVVFNASSQGIMITDVDGVITAINPAFSIITGFASSEVVGHKSSMFKSGRHGAAFFELMWDTLLAVGVWEGEIWNRRKNGEIYPQWLTVSAVRDDQGAIIQFVALFSDISLRKQQEEIIWRQANFDTLTGLANRNLLGDRLERAIAQARRNHMKVGLMFVDLDGFKDINDNYGHDAGDDLLIKVAGRLTHCVREQDTVARLGGDEFTLILQGVDDLADLRAVADKVVGSMHQPFQIKSGEHCISGSVGVVVFPDDGEDPETLLKHADIAMYAAKQAGKNQMLFYRDLCQAGRDN